MKVTVDAELETFTPISGDIVIELAPLDTNATQHDYDTRVATIVFVSDGRVALRISMDAANLLRIGQSLIEISQLLARDMSSKALREYGIALFAHMEQRYGD